MYVIGNILSQNKDFFLSMNKLRVSSDKVTSKVDCNMFIDHHYLVIIIFLISLRSVQKVFVLIILCRKRLSWVMICQKRF